MSIIRDHMQDVHGMYQHMSAERLPPRPTTGQSSTMKMNTQEKMNTKGNEDNEDDKAELSKLDTSVDGVEWGGERKRIIRRPSVVCN